VYLPRHFEQQDPAALQQLMREHPLAALVHGGPDGLTADHLPLEYDAASSCLRGHVARANPLWQRAQGGPVLVLFGGPQAYVSPGWYPGKTEHHKVVPTWNYAVVHAHGSLRAVDDAPWLRALVGRLTDHHEATRPTPWSVNDAPDDYVQQMLRAIVGIEIQVTRLVGKWKLSQNRSQADRQGVVTGLAEGEAAAQALAALMAGPPHPPGATR
jgi:transcriptional regulator